MVVLGVVAWLSLQSGLFSPRWSLLPLAAFVVLIGIHRRILGRCEAARRLAQIYEDGLARIEDRWHGQGKPGSQYLDEAHLYAGDLDIFGEGSLFQLLATTQSRAGDDHLAAWLQAPAGGPSEIRRRQAAVEELRLKLDLREQLQSRNRDAAEGLDSDSLAEWSDEDVAEPSKILRSSLALLAAAQLAATVGWAGLDWGFRPLLVLLFLHSVAALALRNRMKASVRGAQGAGRDLAQLRQVLAKIQSETFKCEALVELQRDLRAGSGSPAEEIDRLRRLIDLLDSARNPMFSPIAILLVWTPQLSLGLEAWRARTGLRIREWVEAAGRLEALLALATYAYEHPDDPFPEIDEGSTPLLVGESLGHPLIGADDSVRNDVRLDSQRQTLVISGSNMSGKSTYLRTVGVNTVLALSGAPVRARKLRVSVLAVGASIQIRDSLQLGHSRFYKEILRARAILRLADDHSTLFLLDEILHGTNSHDRRIGAQAIVRSLLERRAIGLVTTHDLALAAICEDTEVAGENVHFEDEITDGKMHFDYRLRPGVVEKSNAIELMRQVGLEI